MVTGQHPVRCTTNLATCSATSERQLTRQVGFPPPAAFLPLQTPHLYHRGEEFSIIISFSGLTFEIQLRYPGTERYFSDFLAVGGSPTAHLQVTQEDLQRASCYCPSDAPQNSWKPWPCAAGFADLLLSYSRCLFHSAAFAFQGKAYLLAAPSGVGENHPAKPLVAALPRRNHNHQWRQAGPPLQDNGPILVHATPWRGKEALGGTGSAPLGGIVYLRQSQTDRCLPLPAASAILPLLGQCFCTDRTEAHYRLLLPLLKRLVPAAPIWLLENRGGPESTRLCHDHILERKERIPC